MEKKNYLSQMLAAYVCDTLLQGMEDKVRDYAIRSIRDSIGCMVAGMNEPAALSAVQFATRKISEPEANAAGVEKKIDASLAAFVNAVAINVLDYDDVAVTMNGHPSSVILPGVMAAAQKYPVSGSQMLEAYIIGVDVSAMLGAGICPESFERGWHCTAVIGIFGAVAAIGKLAGLNAEQIANAFAVAASEASGVKANLGSMMKPFHCGRAVMKAFDIIDMVLCGCTANLDAIESNVGLGTLIAGKVKVQLIKEKINQGISVFLEPGVAIKPYPSCKRTLNGIDGILGVIKDNNIPKDNIESVSCYVQAEAEREFSQKMDTEEQRKLNLKFCIAAATVQGNITLSSFKMSGVPKEIWNIYNLISIDVDPALDTAPDDAARVIVRTKDGEIYEKYIPNAKGDSKNPMTEQELFFKYMDCCRLNMEETIAEEIWKALGNIEEKENGGEFVAWVMDKMRRSFL